MAYIVVVNPQILSQAGIDHGAAFTATCIAAAIGSAAMGLLANYPLALAPGMGLNAYFTFAVVKGMGLPWQTALGAVFCSGVLFLLISVFRIREWLINTIPLSLKLGIGAGIGLFLGLIGLEDMGLVVANPATLVTMGNVDAAKTAALLLRLPADRGARRARHPRGDPDRHRGDGAARHSVRADALRGARRRCRPRSRRAFLKLDIRAALALGALSVLFTFFLVDVLDNAGTLIATTHRAGLMRPDGTVPRLRQALLADSGGAILGSLLGTSTTTSYIESAAGIEAGGRTGLTAVTVAVLFLLTLFLAPFATAIPGYATAPALVFVACLMVRALRDLAWDDVCEYLPAIVDHRHDAAHLLDRDRHRHRLHHPCAGEAGCGARAARWAARSG